MAFASDLERELARVAEEDAGYALIYADWLEENHRDEEAAFVREMSGDVGGESAYSFDLFGHGHGYGYGDGDGYGDGYGDGDGYGYGYGYGDGDGYGYGYGYG